MIDKNIVFMPSWVAEAIARNGMGHGASANIGMTLASVLKFGEISKVLSASDLVGLIVLQWQAPDYVTGFALSDDAARVSFESTDLYNLWEKQAEADPALRDFFATNIRPRMLSEEGVKSNEARLFSEEGRLTHYDEPFITHDVDREFAVIVIRPGFFTRQPCTGDHLDLFIRATESILNIFHVYMTRDDIAKTFWFRIYLQLLSQKQIMI